MRRIALTLFLINLMLLSAMATELKVAQVQKAQDNSANFQGYAKQQFVLKINQEFLQTIQLKNAERSGRSGIQALDALSSRFAVSAMKQRFPDAPLRFLNGREINMQQWFLVEYAADVDPETVAREYRRLSGVADAQPIGIHKVYASTPNDGSYSSQWHLNQANDHDIDAPEGWDLGTGNPQIIVAILDTGVRYYHKDLGGANASSSNTTAADGNMWINQAEKNGAANVDDDGNGFTDDWIGWDFVTGVSGWTGEDVSTPDNDPRDFNGHGTHCAGIVGAINNNNYAVASPAGGWMNGSQQASGNGVSIMPMRIGYSGRLFIYEVGYVQMDFAASAFTYAANNGARIASCSWGSSNSGGLGDAIDYFVASGGLVFKAAGNDNDEGSDYMLDRADVIGVASTDQNDVKSDFSTYGTFVDISAPGTDIVSTYHDHNDPNNDYVATLSGTSMATPLSAGVAASIWSKHTDWSAAQVKQRLFDTADDISGIPGNSAFAGKLGAGRVNLFNALNDGGVSAPTANFTANQTSGCGSLNVQFTDQSTGDVDSWSWDFGDGGSSTAQNPAHNYTTPGTYTVTLTVTGPGGSDGETKNNYITVNSTVVAAFSGTPLSGDAPLTVNFTDQSTGTPTGWSWDFGDGGSATVQNPGHTFTVAGTYTVTLTASNACGSDGETKVNYVVVNEPVCNPPVADFSGTPISGTAPLTVNFSDLSSNTPTGWSWNFGDGGSATTQNPSHTYTAAGTFTVTLTASNACGSDDQVKTNYITVNENTQPALHVADVTVTKQTLKKRSRGVATVKIVDANGTEVASATVNGTWSGNASGNVQGTTGTSGTVTFYSGWSSASNAQFTFCVTNVSKSGYVYDPAANVEECGNSASGSQMADGASDRMTAEPGEKFAFNAPNPFNPTTNINFYTPEQVGVKVEIYNMLGQKVKTVFEGISQTGMNVTRWDSDDESGSKVSSGVYFFQITFDGKETIRQKILLQK